MITRKQPKHSMRTIIFMTLVCGMLLPLGASGQRRALEYVVRNNGLGGFLDTQSIRLRSQNDRGIKAGDFILWPSLFLEGRYDSNFLQDSGEGSELTIREVPVFRILPGLVLSNHTPNKIAFNLGVQADVRLYASGEELVDERRNVGLRADAYLGILPKGAVTVTILDVFQRTLDARTVPLDPASGVSDPAADAGTYNQNRNQAGIRFGIHPGGRALDITAGYSFIFNKGDDTNTTDYFAHDILLRGTWRFYPKTAMLIESTLRVMDWSPDAEIESRWVDNMPFRVYAGLSGYITNKLATLFKVGYGNSFHDVGESFNHVIGQAELSYTFTPDILVAAGFLRDFQPSIVGNVRTENRTYLRGQFTLARRVHIDLTAAYFLVDFSDFDPAAADPVNQGDTFVSHKERREQHISGHLRVDVDILRWLGISVGYEAQAVLSNYTVTKTSAGGAQTVDPAKFVRHQVYGSLNVRY